MSRLALNKTELTLKNAFPGITGISVLLCIMLVHSNDASAFEWRDLWLNKDQQAMRALEDEQPDKAVELFNDEDWQAAARYRAGDFVGAEDLLKLQADERSLYNRGNALARQGHYEEAIAVYDDVLKNNPVHKDAKFNKVLIEKELEKQQQQKQSQSNQNRDPQQQDPQQEQSQQQDPQQQDPQQQKTMDQNTGQQESQQQDSAADPQPADTEQQQSPQSQQAQEQQETEEQGDEQQQAMNEQQQEKSSEDPKQVAAGQQTMRELDEQQQATEQWLRRIPDDPAGLLRRKFKYQYQRQNKKPTTDKYW